MPRILVRIVLRQEGYFEDISLHILAYKVQHRFLAINRVGSLFPVSIFDYVADPYIVREDSVQEID